MVAELFSPASGLELVDVEVHRDRRARMSHLTLDANGVEAALGEMGTAGVPQVMEGELRDAGRIEVGGVGRFVEPTGGDVA